MSSCEYYGGVGHAANTVHTQQQQHAAARSAPLTVHRRVAVEARQGAGEDRDLLAAVVADDADVEADGGRLGRERHLGGARELHACVGCLGGGCVCVVCVLNVRMWFECVCVCVVLCPLVCVHWRSPPCPASHLQARRVEAHEREIVHRVKVEREDGQLLAVVEDRLGDDGAGRHHVAVGQDDAARRVDDKAGRVRRRRRLGVAGARLRDPGCCWCVCVGGASLFALGLGVGASYDAAASPSHQRQGRRRRRRSSARLSALT